MGQVLLPSGGAINVDEFHGSIEIGNLVRELKISDLTDSYRVAVIGCLGRIGKAASMALSDLKKLTEGNNRILKDAAQYAIKNIESDVLVVVDNSVTKNTLVPLPPPTVTNNGHHRHHSRPPKERYKAELNPIKKTNNLFDGCPVLTECHYCQKIYESSKSTAELNKILVGDKKYCRFCMRNKYYKPEMTKSLVILSYRALISYTYYSFVQGKSHIYINELKDMIQDHVTASSSNPLFNYDPETFNWYIDMEAITKNKIGLEVVSPTIVSQLSVLGIAEIFYRGTPYSIYKNIMRKLASGDSFIMPMPQEGGAFIDQEKGIPREYLLEFNYSHLLDSTAKNSRKWDNGKKEKEWNNYGNGYCG